MGRLFTGVILILFVLVVNLFVAFIETGATSADGFDASCSGNATQCQADAQGQAGFFSNLFDAAVSPFDGEGAALDLINGVWLLVMITLLSLGVLLIVLSVVPLTSE